MKELLERNQKKMSFLDASTVPLCGLTSWECIFEQLVVNTDPKKNEGKSILIINGAGGVGSYAIQIAKCAGLIVVATASRKETIDFCKNLGADFVISHKEDLYEQIKKIEKLNGGVNYVFNCHSTDLYFDKLPELMHPSGRAVFIVETKKEFKIGNWMGKRLSFSYEFMFSKLLRNYMVETQGEYLNSISDLIDNGKIKSTLTKSFHFTSENLSKAHEELESNVTIGKIALHFNEKKE